ADGPAPCGAEHRHGQRTAQRASARRGRGRQCRAAPAAADHRRKGSIRSGRHDRTRLRAAGQGKRARTEAGRGMKSNGVRHFLDLIDIPKEELRVIIEGALSMKARRKRGDTGHQPLKGYALAMIFDKPSTRTRVSFDMAMRQLGGDALMLTGAEMQLGRGETIADTARVMSRYVDAIMIRTLDPDMVAELAKHATI